MGGRVVTDRGWVLALWGAAALCAGGLSAGAPVAIEASRGQPSFEGPLPVVVPLGYPFRGGPARLGRSSVAGPASADAVVRYRIGAQVTGAAAVDARGVYVGAHDGTLYAFDRALQLRSRWSLGGPVFGSVVIAPDGALLVGSDGGALHSVGPGGEQRFAYDVGAPVDTAVAVAAPGVLVAGGRVLHALDAAGALRWSFEARGKIFTTAALDPQGVIHFAAQDHVLYALGPDGVARWRLEVGHDIDGGPMLLPDGRVIVGDDGGVVRCVRPGGVVAWERSLGGHVRAPPALGAADTVLINVHGPRARLVGLDPDDGGLRFEYMFGPADGSAVGTRSGPLVDRDGNIYVGAHDDRLHALDARGQRRWTFTTAGDIDASPVLSAEGTLYFGSRDGFFYGIRRE